MMDIKIRDLEVYHGSTVVDNSYYIEHFKKLGKDIKKFWEETMGRKYRYHIDPEKENGLTMAIEASKKVLQKSKLTGEDIDMIVYSSVMPEYVSPPSSLIIHNAIKGKQNCYCHDMNVNCIGMTYALDLIYRYISANPQVNRVLLVGSDYLNIQVSPENELCYGQYGDAACAVIIEKTTDDAKLIDTRISVNSNSINDVRFPKCGFSNIYDATREEIHAKWIAYDTSWLDKAIENMNSILDEHKLSVNDISMFCLSQFSYKNIVYLREKMNIEEKKSIYIGDTYGYTGTSSPFIALYEALKDGRVKRGDYVMFWTVAAGTTHIAVLIKY